MPDLTTGVATVIGALKHSNNVVSCLAIVAKVKFILGHSNSC